MSLTTPCIIIFNDWDYETSIQLPYVEGTNMTFMTINNSNLSSGWDATTTHHSLLIGMGIVRYDGVDVYTGGGSEPYTQYWDDPLARAIYVTNWGTAAGSDLDNLETYLVEYGYGTIVPATGLAGLMLKFNDSIIPYRTNGDIDFSSNGNTYDYINWVSANDYTMRYFIGSSYIEPYTGDTWVNISYQNIMIGNTGDDLTKSTFVMWVLLNTIPLTVKTYSLGWRYTPQSS